MENDEQPKLGPLMRRWGLFLIVSGIFLMLYSFWIDKARFHKPTDGVPVGGVYQ